MTIEEQRIEHARQTIVIAQQVCNRHGNAGASRRWIEASGPFLRYLENTLSGARDNFLFSPPTERGIFG